MNFTKAKASLRAYYSWISGSPICLSFHRKCMNEETPLLMKALYIDEISLELHKINVDIIIDLT